MHPDLQPAGPVPLRPVPMTLLEATIVITADAAPLRGTGDQEAA
jgi:hypothetical protein